MEYMCVCKAGEEEKEREGKNEGRKMYRRKLKSHVGMFVIWKREGETEGGEEGDKLMEELNKEEYIGVFV